MYVCVWVCGSLLSNKKKRSKYFKMNKSTYDYKFGI